MDKTIRRIAAVVFASSVFSVSCGNRSPSSKDDSLKETVPAARSAAQVDQGAKAAAAPDDPQKNPGADTGDKTAPSQSDQNEKLLQKEDDSLREVLISHDARGLVEKERKMLGHLIEAARLTEELYMLQLHPRSIEWRQELLERRDPIRQKLFARYRSPWCLETACALLEDLPPKNLFVDLWPADLTDEEFGNLERQINARELLSPFTVVHRREGRGYTAIPYGRFERFSTRMRVIADELAAASKLAADPSLAKFLLSRAEAFVSSSAFPFDQSDYDWIASKGDWEVTVGPYETYSSPRQTKALFEMIIGRIEPALTAQMSRLEEHLPAMEAGLAELLGTEIRKASGQRKNVEIRVIDVWYAAGQARPPKGAILAYHLPNRGPSAQEGMSKKVIMANHSRAFDPLTAIRAEMSFVPQLVGLVDGETKMKNTLYHELAHGFGANADTKILDKKGRSTTVKLALGRHEAVVEELKADAVALWLAALGLKQGWLSDDELKKRTACAVLHALGLLMHPAKTTSARMSAVELGWLLERGAIAWDGEAEKLDVSFEAMPEAVEELVKKVVSIQLSGDRQAAEELERRYVLEGKRARTSQVAQVREALREAFLRDKIPTPALSYEVTGLSPMEAK